MARASARCTKWSEMSTYRPALIVIMLGLLTFGIVFTLLEFSRSAAAPSETVAEPTATATLAAATNSLAAQIQAGDLAVGVPIAGSESLLRDVQPGDRVDVLATENAVTAVVVRGARV